METKKKVLFVATVDSHIELFHLPYLKMFKDKGWEVHVATDTDKPIKYCDKKIKLPIKRSPFKLSNLKAIRELKKIIDDEKYEIVHCHTPMGGVVARLAARKARRNGTRVIYTAHGFHFYKGAPILNWMLYYPVEKWLSKYTDTLITINTEDYERAKKKFYCGDVHKIHGIGVDESKFEKKYNARERKKIRDELKINQNDFVVTYVAELSSDKNHKMAIDSIKKMHNRNKSSKKVKLLLVGRGSCERKLQMYVKRNNLSDSVIFLGFRSDVDRILSISNLEIATSKREGLGLHLAEAMYMNVPVVATLNRGHKELVKDAHNGILVKLDDMDGLANSISLIMMDDEKRRGLAKNADLYVKRFLLSNTKKEMLAIYNFDDNHPLRVLQIFNTMLYGGAENMIMNIYRNIDREKVQFDFLVHGECAFAEEIKQLGGKIYILPGYINKLGPLKYKSIIKNFFKNNHGYRIVHCHLDITSGFIFNVIKKVYNPTCISHAHCCENMKNNVLVKIYKIYLKNRLNKNADIKIACSNEAGKWMFGNNYIVMNNPIDASFFSVDMDRRKKTRKYLGLTDGDYVIGTIGRLEPIKNQKLLIAAFRKAFPASRFKNVKLMIVGDGSLKNDIIKDTVNDKRIKLLQPISDVFKYYEVFDLFALPSIKEGFSMVLIEAYYSGLPILASKGIPEQVLSDVHATIVSDFGVDTWAEILRTISEKNLKRIRTIPNERYNAKNIARQLEKVYYECRK